MAVAEADEGTARLHACRDFPEHGVTIQRASDLRDDDSLGWVLSIYREATEEDLGENHYLEQIGELIWNTRLEIRHCPFCGEKLAPTESKMPPSSPKHYDYSGWSVKES